MATLDSPPGNPRARLGPAGNGTCAPSHPLPASASATDRDARGRFAPGNKSGTGNPYARRVAALRQAMLDVVKPEDLQAIIVRLVLAAQQGDVAASRLVLAYTLGKPAPTVDPDALDLAEWHHWQQMPVSPEALAGLLGPLQVPLACLLARGILPHIQDAVSKKLAQELNPTSPPPAQPQLPNSAVAEASPAPAARAEGPTPGPVPAEPPAWPAPTGPTIKTKGKPKEMKGAGGATESVSRLARGDPNVEHAEAGAELRRWLELCEQFLVPNPTANKTPDLLAGVLSP